MDTVDYKEKFEKLIQRIDDLIVNGWIDEKAGKAILKDFTLESEDERIRKELISLIKETHVTDRYYDLNKMLAWLEKQGKNDMGISEATKQELEDNLNKALEKETPESWNKFLDEQGEQKSVRSEEDESILQNILVCLKNGWRKVPTDILKYESWLKSLKERVQPQPKQELNEDAPTNEYVNLGLPSGTLWKSANEEGYYTFDYVVEKFNNQLPIKEQWEELKDKCKWEWKDNGYEVTGPNGNMIFLPADGYNLYTEVQGVGAYGGYWSSTYYDSDFAWYMCFGPGFIYTDYYRRNDGRSVRLVKDVY